MNGLNLTDMEQQERVQLYNELMDTFGYEHQMHVACEECAELTNALMKKERGRATDDEVLDEVADVIICMEQLALHFGVAKAVEAKERKLQRLKERLQGVTEAAKDGRDTDTEAAAEPPLAEKTE